MNILIFSPVPSHPQDHGNRKRIFMLAKYLQRLGHRIHFVYFTQRVIAPETFDRMSLEWDTLTIIKQTDPCTPSTTGYSLDAWYQNNIHEIVNEMVDIFDIDMVLLNYIFQSKLFNYLPGHVLKVIDTHDAFTDRHLLYAGKGDRPYTWFSVSKEDEGRAMDRADIIIAIQNEEADYFSMITRTPVLVINHFEEEHRVDRSYRFLKTIGYIGSGNLINVSSLNDFIQAYFNRSKVKGDVRIVVAGNICNAVKMRHDNLHLLGIVDDLEGFYGQVDLVINPQTFGTGLKIKCIEALAYGVPIVSTKIGFEGIESPHSYHQIDTLNEMVAVIEHLCSTPKELTELAMLSRDVFNQYEKNTKKAIAALLDTVTPREEKKLIQTLHCQLQEKEAIILRQYRLLQSKAFYAKQLGEKDYNLIMSKIAAIAEISTVKMPLQKITAYKQMLATFYRLRKEQLKA